MIDIHKEKLISVVQATGLVPPTRPGRKTHASTIIRWIHRGVRGRHSKRSAWAAAGTRLLRRSRFAQYTPTSEGESTDASRRSRARRADRELDKLGL